MSEIIRAEPYQPRNPEEAMAVARQFAVSGLLGKIPPKPETVLYLMARGHELGFSTAQSLAAFHIIDGVPTLKAESQQALCLSHPDICERFQLVESTPEKATYVAKRRGNEKVTEYTYTIEDARKAGLGEKPVWKAHPREMLRARCISALGQIEFPDILLGISTPEEQAEVAEREGRVLDVDPETGDVLPDAPERTRSRAVRAQVRQDLKDITKDGGAGVAERLKAEEAAAVEGEILEARPPQQVSSAEEAMNPPKARTAPDAARAAEVPPESSEALTPEDGAVAPPETASAASIAKRETLIAGLKLLDPAAKKEYYAALSLSYQNDTVIRERISEALVDKMLAALPGPVS